MSKRFYEPWRPRQGQRVRISVSPECQIQGDPTSIQARTNHIGHRTWEQGKTGTVRLTKTRNAFLAAQGHRCLVIWDEPAIVDGERVLGASYAIVELEPLPARAAVGSVGAHEPPAHD